MSMDHGAEGQINVHMMAMVMGRKVLTLQGPAQSVSSALSGFFIAYGTEQSFLLHHVKEGWVLCLLDSATQTG